jgi:hypothetical protein
LCYFLGNENSFRLDIRRDFANEGYLLDKFVAYLILVLNEESYNTCISQGVSEESKHAGGFEFVKTVWDFIYSTI